MPQILLDLLFIVWIPIMMLLLLDHRILLMLLVSVREPAQLGRGMVQDLVGGHSDSLDALDMQSVLIDMVILVVLRIRFEFGSPALVKVRVALVLVLVVVGTL